MTAASREPQRPPIPLVYLLAASHSGSTLLALLLGSHPEVATVGELKLTSLGELERYRCGCGETILSCPFWADVTRRMRASGIAFDLSHTPTDLATGASAFQRRLLKPLARSRGLERIRDAALALTPGWQAHLSQVQRANAALAATVLELTGRRIIVDSSKIGMRLKYLLRNPAFDVRIVRLIRDGRAVALTYTDPSEYADARRPELRGGGRGGTRDSERLPMQRAAREWRRANEEADEILRSVPAGRSLEVRYEELCANPDLVLGRVFEFVGVPPRDLASLASGRRVRHVVGNGMRLDWDGTISLDARWSQALSPEALAAFDAEAGALNRRLGYGAAAAGRGGPLIAART